NVVARTAAPRWTRCPHRCTRDPLTTNSMAIRRDAAAAGKYVVSPRHELSRLAMPPPKLIPLAAAVPRYARDGMQYASGAALPIGSDAVVFGRELLRQRRRDLHAIFHCNSQQLNLLAGAGAVSRAECGFTGLEVFGFANGLRRAVEAGRLVLEDYS